MLVTCKECNTSFTLEDGGIKKSGTKVRCSRCKNIFVVYPHEPVSTPEIPEDFKEEFEELVQGSGKEGDFTEEEEIDFDEIDKMLEAGDELELEEAPEAIEEEPALPGVGDIDFSELEKALDIDESLKDVETIETVEQRDKPEEEINFDELDKTLGMDENLELEELPKIAEEKSSVKERDDIGLYEIEKALGADESSDTGKEDFNFADLEKELGADEEPEPEEITEIMKDESALLAEEDIGFPSLKKTLGTDEVPKTDKAPETEQLVFDELDKMFGADDEQAEKVVPESLEGETAVSESGEFDFSDLEKELDMDESPKDKAAAEAGKQTLQGEEDLDLSDLDNLFDTEKTPAAETVVVKEEKDPGFFDTEEIDFSDLEKMLETGEIKLDDMGLKKIGGKSDDEEAFDLLDLETAIDKSFDDGIEEVGEEPEELKFDFEPEKAEILSKIDDVQEIDFSDLEDMAVSEEAAKPAETHDVETEDINFNFDLEGKTAEKERAAEEAADLDLSDLDTILSGTDEFKEDIPLRKAAKEPKLDFDLEVATGETPAGAEPAKTYEDTTELDFSDLENILVGEKPGVGKEVDSEQQLEFNLDLSPSDDQAEAHTDGVTELDLSDIDRMLEMEGVTGEKEPDGEVLELQLEEDDSSVAQKADKFADTFVSDGMGFKITSEELEHEDVHKHLRGFEIDKFQETTAIEDKKGAVVSKEKKKREIKKPGKPFKAKKSSGRFIIILGIIAALLLGAAAFAVYNPFDIEIPFVSDFLGSKGDEKGNLKITPINNSINGDYVDTKHGTLFVIKGKIKNDYKHPRSYIKVIGKLYAEGKKLSVTESVYCGNIISEQEIANLEPSILKKRFLNRSGDNKSNVKVKPGGTVPFMIIYENPSPDLYEFTVEAESSMKE